MSTFSQSVSQSVSDSVCVQGRGLEITVYNWTWGGMDTLGMNCTCEHTVHGVHTKHNVHTVQFELFSDSGSEFVHKGEVLRFQFINLWQKDKRWRHIYMNTTS